MKKSIWLAGILVFFTLSGLAQADFRPGFIIKNNGDTLNGLVFYSVEGKFDNTCRFKRFEIASEFTYNPLSLKAFGFRNGRYFETKITGNRKSFFECLLKGEVSVFVKPGKSGGMVYLESPSTGFFMLARGNSRLEGAGSFTSYHETLKYLLDKTGSTSVSVNSVKYEARDIVSAVREASSLTSKPPQAFNPTPNVHYLSDYSLTNTRPFSKIGLNAGYQFLILDIAGTGYSDYFREAKYNFTYRPVIGFYFNRQLSRKSSLASVELALNYLTDTYYGYAEYSDGAVTYRSDIEFDITSLQVPLYLKLTFGKQKIHPYLKAGVYKSFLIDHSYHRFSEEQFNNDIYTDNITDFDFAGDVGFQGGAGLEFNMGTARSFGIDALYTYGNQVLKHESSGEQNTSLETGGFAVMVHVNF